jgi:hypothetical protein
MDKLRVLRLVKPFGEDKVALSGMSSDEANAIPAKI